MLAGEVEDRARVLQGDVVERVVDDVLADALLAAALQVDHGGQPREARAPRLEPLELVGVDPQRQVGDLLVAAHRRVESSRRARRSSGSAPDTTRRREMAESLDADAGKGLKALGVNCTLKKSPETSNTEALMNRVLGLLAEHGVETEILRPVDYDDQVRRQLRRGGRRRVAADPGEDQGRRHPADGDVDLVRGPLLGDADGDRAPRRDLQRDQRGRPVPALQQGRRRGRHRQRGRRPRQRRDDPVQHDPPRLRGAAQRRHLLGRRRRARGRHTSTPAGPSTPTPSGPAPGAPTTCCTWRGSCATTRSRRSATRWRSTAATRCTAAERG